MRYDSRVQSTNPRVRHVRAPHAIHFPSEAEVPETLLHYELRTALYMILKHALAAKACIGSDQFVYWNAKDPKKCLAPDVFVKLGSPFARFDSWKTWERGAPELAVEIVSEFDRFERTFEVRLGRYHELGVLELVRFDADGAPGKRLRVWDRLEGDLVERIVEQDVTPCLTLGLFWQVCTALGFPTALRLSEDEQGERLLPTKDEAADHARQAADQARHAADQARQSAEHALAAALAEIERLKRER